MATACHVEQSGQRPEYIPGGSIELGRTGLIQLILESLFAQTDRELADDDFNAQVLAHIERHRRNVLIGRLAIVVLLVALELLLSAPLQNSVGIFTQFLSTTLVELQSEWLALVVAPLNSIAGLIGMLLPGMHYLYRKMVRQAMVFCQPAL